MEENKNIFNKKYHNSKEFDMIYNSFIQEFKTKYKEENIRNLFKNYIIKKIKELFTNDKLANLNKWRQSIGEEAISLDNLIQQFLDFFKENLIFINSENISKRKKDFLDISIFEISPLDDLGMYSIYHNYSEALDDATDHNNIRPWQAFWAFPIIAFKEYHKNNYLDTNQFYKNKICRFDKKKPGLIGLKPPKIDFDHHLFLGDLEDEIESFFGKNLSKYGYLDSRLDGLFFYFTHFFANDQEYSKIIEAEKNLNSEESIKQSIQSIETFERFLKGLSNTQNDFKEVKNKQIYKCPVCKKAKYNSVKLLENHVIKEHNDEIPNNMPVEQYIFNLRNKKDHGTCVICGNMTNWNPAINKYHRFCSEKCKEKYIKIAKERLKKIHGTDNLAKDPDHQKKMLQNRKISGLYKYSDGTTLSYTGSYEKDFLEYNDVVLHIDSKTIQPCDFVFKYQFENKEHFYIPDYYIPSLNLIIEIKDRGNDHPNIAIKMKSMDIEKFKAIMKENKYNFIVVAGKDYTPYIELLEYLKSKSLNEESDNKFIYEIPKDIYKDFLNSSEGIVKDTISAFGSGIKQSIFGPSKKEKEAENKKKELEAKKEEIYNNFKKEINFHTIFNLKHPKNKITKNGIFKCSSGKILMGDGDNFYEEGIVNVPKGNYNFELSRLIDGRYINALVFRFQLNKNKIASFKEISSCSIDSGVCSIAEGSDINILISKMEQDETFYEDFDTFIQFELDDMDIFKHSKLKHPIYSVNSGGDGVFYSQVALDSNGRPVEFYFIFGYIEDYIDIYKEKEIKEEMNKLNSSEGISNFFKKKTSKLNNIDELFNINHPLFRVANYGKYSFPSGKFIINHKDNPNVSESKSIDIPSSEFLITSSLLTHHKSQAYDLVGVRFLFNNKSKPVNFKLVDSFKLDEYAHYMTLYDCNDNDYKLLKTMSKELNNEIIEELEERSETAASNLAMKTQIDELNIKKLNHKKVLLLLWSNKAYIIKGYDEKGNLVALYFSSLKLETFNDILINPDKEKILKILSRGE